MISNNNHNENNRDETNEFSSLRQHDFYNTIQHDNHESHQNEHQETLLDTASYSTSSFNVIDEIWLMIQLSISIIIQQLSMVIPGVFLSSYIGRYYGSIYLDALTLATLIGNLYILTLIEGIYSTLKTLIPQSFGSGNYRDIPNILSRSYFVCLFIFIPLNIFLCLYIYTILQWMGEDSIASYHAKKWFRIYTISFPIEFINQILSIYLSSQHIMVPQTIISLFTTISIFPICIYYLGSYFGFQGTSISIVILKLCQLFILVIYLYVHKPYHPETDFNKFHSFRDVIQIDQFKSFIWLTSGAMLASAYWIYWEISSLMMGQLGVIALSVHAIAGQVVMFIFMIPFGYGIAMSIRIGNVLPQSPKKAKTICYYSFIIGTMMFLIMSICVYIFRHSIITIFTNETIVFDGCLEIWDKVAFYLFNLSLYAMFLGICIGLGQQAILGCICIIYLWFIGLPATYYFAIVNGGGINIAWKTMCPIYFGINVTIIVFIIRLDWEDIAKQIRLREGNTEISNVLTVRKEDTAQYGAI